MLPWLHESHENLSTYKMLTHKYRLSKLNQAPDEHVHTHKPENQEKLNLEELSPLTMNRAVYGYFL